MPETTTNQPDLESRRTHERSKYLALAEKGWYGKSNHGRHAYDLVRGFVPRPRFVVDFGCGRNTFIGHLRRLGLDGLGIDFAFPEADLVTPMHRTTLAAGIADVVTSFDALEHLLPEEVDEVIAEMRRVAVPRGRLVVRISCRPSTNLVGGEGLHPTVQPLRWWMDKLRTVATVEQQGIYVVGRFKDVASVGAGGAGGAA